MNNIKKYLTTVAIAALPILSFGQMPGVEASQRVGKLGKGLHAYTTWSDKNWNNKTDSGELMNHNQESYDFDRRKDVKFALYDDDIRIGLQTRCMYYITEKETGEVVYSDEFVLENKGLNHLIGPFGSQYLFEAGKTYQLKVGNFKNKKNRGKEYTLEYKLE